MQITRNSTGLLAERAVVADKDARDYCVVVIKGTFISSPDGSMVPAAEQVPFVYADEHYGDPESTGIRYESDFALYKPLTDVVVVGRAVAPNGQPAAELAVRLEVDGRIKDALVVGERRWVRAAGGYVVSRPVPFLEMPLTFERAFGGVASSSALGRTAEPRNLVGVGIGGPGSSEGESENRLPNVEDLHHRVRTPRDRPPPVGFGFVGRSWTPRATFVGTYDQRWLDEVCPFLPEDFDHRYFQGAPADQQYPHFRGGEVIRCVHMSHAPVVQYVIPRIEIPVVFCFEERDVSMSTVLDTVLLEPHDRRAVLTWRARIVLGKRLEELEEIRVGEQPRTDDGFVGYRRGKPVFRGVSSTIRWLQRRRRR